MRFCGTVVGRYLLPRAAVKNKKPVNVGDMFSVCLRAAGPGQPECESEAGISSLGAPVSNGTL